MSVLVGYTPDQAGHEALSLGRVLTARGAELIVCTVIPEIWGHPSLTAVDREYGEFLEQHAQQALDLAREQLGGQAARYLKYAATSATLGLIGAAKQEGAKIIVLGSSRASAVGRLALGSAASEIMHLSEVPVAMAPHNYHLSPAAHIPRLTCAYSGLEAARATVLSALGLATDLGVPLRLASFAVRDHQMYPSLVGYRAEDGIVATWREQAGASLSRIKADLAAVSPPVETCVADGATWEDALGSIDWQPGEVLALGSSRMGVLARVFLGPNANKIIRASPVPVMVLPKSA